MLEAAGQAGPAGGWGPGGKPGTQGQSCWSQTCAGAREAGQLSPARLGLPLVLCSFSRGPAQPPPSLQPPPYWGPPSGSRALSSLQVDSHVAGSTTGGLPGLWAGCAHVGGGQAHPRTLASLALAMRPAGSAFPAATAVATTAHRSPPSDRVLPASEVTPGLAVPPSAPAGPCPWSSLCWEGQHPLPYPQAALVSRSWWRSPRGLSLGRGEGSRLQASGGRVGNGGHCVPCPPLSPARLFPPVVFLRLVSQAFTQPGLDSRPLEVGGRSLLGIAAALKGKAGADVPVLGGRGASPRLPGASVELAGIDGGGGAGFIEPHSHRASKGGGTTGLSLYVAQPPGL